MKHVGYNVKRIYIYLSLLFNLSLFLLILIVSFFLLLNFSLFTRNHSRRKGTGSNLDQHTGRTTPCFLLIFSVSLQYSNRIMTLQSPFISFPFPYSLINLSFNNTYFALLLVKYCNPKQYIHKYSHFIPLFCVSFSLHLFLLVYVFPVYFLLHSSPS